MPDETNPELIPRAEVERLVAEAVAIEQKKRRRVEFALAAAVGFLLLTGGALAWWRDGAATERRVEWEQDEALRARLEAHIANLEEAAREKARATRLESSIRHTLNAEAVERLLARCEQALREHNTSMAVFALREAERRIVEGGADHLIDRVTRARADLDELQELHDSDNKNGKLSGLGGLETAPPPREVTGP